MPDQAARRLGVTLTSLFVAALVLLFLSKVAQILVLAFIAILLGIYFSAFTDAILQRANMGRALALSLAVLATTAATVGMGWLIVPPVIEQTSDFLTTLPDNAQRLESQLLRLAQRYPLLERALGPEGGGVVEGMLASASQFIQASILPYLTASTAIAIELVAVIAMALYFARDSSVYRDGLIAVFPPRVRHIVRAVLADLGETLRAWIWAQLISMLVLTILTWVGLVLLRVPYSLAFGVFTGLVGIVPFFGTLVSTVLPALFVLTQGGWGHVLAVTALGVGVHLVGSNVVQPLVFERRLNIPPLLTILSILIAGATLGALGIVVAVPLLACIIVVVRHVLLTHLYGDHDPRVFESAVLVSTTGTRHAVAMTPQ
jgi:predicted PurR-regulated permease PerM